MTFRRSNQTKSKKKTTWESVETEKRIRRLKNERKEWHRIGKEMIHGVSEHLWVSLSGESERTEEKLSVWRDSGRTLVEKRVGVGLRVDRNSNEIIERNRESIPFSYGIYRVYQSGLVYRFKNPFSDRIWIARYSLWCKML